MAAYRYSDYLNPYVGSIAENLGKSADAKARGLEIAAQAHARGQEISGQAWGNAASDIGRTVGGTIAAYDNPRRKLDEAQLQDVRQRQAGEQKLSSLLTPYQPTGPQPEGAGPAPAQHPYLDEQGLYDIQKLSEALGASGIAHLAPELLKGAEQINGSILEHQKRQADLGAAETVMVGDMAYGARQLVKAGVPITQAIDLAAAPGLATQRFSQPQVDQIKAKLATLPPEQQDAALGSLMDAAAQIAPKKEHGKDTTESDRYNRTTFSNILPEKPKTREIKTVENGQEVTKIVPDEAGASYPTPPQAAAKKGLQSKSVLIDGKPAEASFNPEDGSWEVGGKPIDATRVKPMPPASSVSIVPNADALEMAAKKYLATGELPSMGMGQAGVAARVAVMNRAAQIDPQASLAANKAAYKADSANLSKLQTTEGTLSAFEKTAGKNLDQFLTLAKDIPDTGLPWLNTPVRLLTQQAVGSANMAAINAARDVALREIARVTNDPKLTGALTDSARKEVLGLSAANATLPQIKAVATVLKQDMANVHSGLNEQIATIKSGLQGNPAAAQSAPVGRDRVIGPNGETGTVPRGTALPSGWRLQ